MLASLGHTRALDFKSGDRWRWRVHPRRSDLCRFHRCGVAHQASLRSLQTMMTYANSLPKKREAGSLINRTVTIRTKPRFRHPRTGGTALLLPTTTELFITDLVSQHDPQANPQLACHRHTRFPHTLLH